MSSQSPLSLRKPNRFVVILGACPSLLIFAFLLTLAWMAPTPTFAQETGQSTREPDQGQKIQRGFIGVPNAKTLYVQTLTQGAVVTITYRSFTLGSSIVVTDSLAARWSQSYAAPPNFRGGAIIESSAPVYVANLDLTEQGNAAYLGFERTEEFIRSQDATDADPQSLPYVIQLKQAYTTFCVQNLSAVSAFGTVYHHDENGALVDTESLELQPLQSQCFVGRVNGSVIVASSQPIEVATVDTEDRLQGLRAIYPAIPLGGYADTFYVPSLFKNWDLQTSRLCIQNANPTPIDLFVTYTDGVAQQVSNLAQLVCYDQGTETDANGNAHADNWIGGATITATGQIAVAVAVFSRETSGVERGFWAYTPPSQPLAERRAIAFPILFDGANQWTSTVFLYNPSNEEATVRAFYTDRSGTDPCAEDRFTIPAGQTVALTSDQFVDFVDEGMAFFVSSKPLAAVTSGTSTKALTDISDRHFGYEAAYPLLDVGITEIPAPSNLQILDEYFSLQQDYYQSIGATEMWALGFTGAATACPITIAVIDTGVDLNHPDLQDNLAPGYDFVENDTVPQDTSDDSHGTKVAGVIAARMNNGTGNTAVGIVGIGGGDAISGTSGLQIMPLRVAVQSTNVDCELSAQAIDYARLHGARIINMSYSGDEACPQELDAIERAYAAGIALVAGAGNDNRSTPVFPAAYGADNPDLVLSVAGVYPSGVKGDLSNYGMWVDMSAPYRVVSTATGNRYESDAGTSFSAPFVSGLLGVLMSNFGWTRDEAIAQVRQTLERIDDQNPTQLHGLLGGGRIRADRASTLTIKLYLPMIEFSTQDANPNASQQ